MFWLWFACGFLTFTTAVLLIKIILFHRDLDALRRDMAARMDMDTNTLISIASGDRYIRRFAAGLNQQLRLLRRERRRLQSGDRELKDAITNISHDLRTPLTAICGYLSLLEKEETSENAARYLSVIGNRTETLRQLTEELFHYSIIVSTTGEISFEDLCINAVLEESIAAYYAVFKSRGISPDIQLPEERVIRPLNREALSRIFSNILNNALKYSDGDLSISLSPAGELAFTNSAACLNAVQVEKLFDRFYTVESAKKSTGLGLSIAKTLTEEMHGKIFAQYCDNKLSIKLSFGAGARVPRGIKQGPSHAENSKSNAAAGS